MAYAVVYRGEIIGFGDTPEQAKTRGKETLFQPGTPPPSGWLEEAYTVRVKRPEPEDRWEYLITVRYVEEIHEGGRAKHFVEVLEIIQVDDDTGEVMQGTPGEALWGQGLIPSIKREE